MLDRRLPSAASVRVLTALERSSQELGLAVSHGETFWFVEAQLQDVVADHLARATEGNEEALHALLPSFATGCRILVRTGQRRDAWSRLRLVHGLEHVEVIGTGEARLENEVRSGSFEVFYDSGALAQLDMSSSNRSHYIEPATRRWQHGLEQSTVPPTFSRVLLEG
jgi:hypothetical protein